MGERRVLVAGNWKMHLGPEAGLALFRRLRRRLPTGPGVEVLICPPFVTLPALAAARPAHGRRVMLGAQDCHWAEAGAFTGDVSPWMLREICEWVIVGHSERREHHQESDRRIHRKIEAAIEAGLRPILCVGEGAAEREAGETASRLRAQMEGALGDLSAAAVADHLVVAYEPIWAIGSGAAASPVEANRVAALLLRGVLAERYGEQVAARVRVLYGGSVKAENAAAFFLQPELDGALVGGASLDPAAFAAIVAAAAAAR